MNIGIDLDGVLTYIDGFYKFNKSLRNAELSDTRDIFHCSDEELRARWKRYLVKYATIQPAREGARDLMKKLKQDGHTVFIISKRAYTCRTGMKGKFMRFLVKGWLIRNRIKFKEIVFCDSDLPDSKRDVCLDLGIDVLIDDEPVNIYSVAADVTPICFDAKYNRSCSGGNILRAKDFDETYHLINGIASERGILGGARRKHA